MRGPRFEVERRDGADRPSCPAAHSRAWIRVRRVGGRESFDVDELVREIANLREQRRAVDEVLRAGARSEGLQPVLDAIVEAATRLCHGEHGQLYLAEGDVFVIVAQILDAPEGYDYAKEHPHLRDRTTVVGRTALAGEVVQIPDVLTDPEYSFGAQAIIGYRALLGVPVVLDEELIGVVSVGRNIPGAFAEQEVELVRTFADQAAHRDRERAPTRDGGAATYRVVALPLAAGCRAHLLGAGRTLARGTSRLHHLPVLRSARVHVVRRDRRARRAVRGAPPLPRDDRRADPGLRRNARALRGRRDPGLLQRSRRARRPRARRGPPRAGGAGAVRGAGADVAQGRHGPRTRDRDRGRVRHRGPHRLRGALRLRGPRIRDEPDLKAQHPRRGGPDPDRSSGFRGRRRGGRHRVRRGPGLEGVRPADPRLRGSRTSDRRVRQAVRPGAADTLFRPSRSGHSRVVTSDVAASSFFASARGETGDR